MPTQYRLASDQARESWTGRLTTLNLRVQRKELERPHVDATHGDLIRRKGDEHETAYHGVPHLAGDSSATYELLVAKKLSEAE